MLRKARSHGAQKDSSQSGQWPSWCIRAKDYTETIATEGLAIVLVGNAKVRRLIQCVRMNARQNFRQGSIAEAPPRGGKKVQTSFWCLFEYYIKNIKGKYQLINLTKIA